MKAKKRALNTAMMRELRAEYSEAPEEVRDDLNLHRIKQSKSDQHRTDYEEDNFKRVMLTKDEKVRMSLRAPSPCQLVRLNRGKVCVEL